MNKADLIKKKKTELIEYKKITCCIFEGLTIKDISEKLSYSRSTVCFKLKKLFKQYKVRTKNEFIIAIFSEIVKDKKNKLKNALLKIEELQILNEKLKKALSNIITNQNKKDFTQAIKEAKSLLK